MLGDRKYKGEWKTTENKREVKQSNQNNTLGIEDCLK